MSASALAGPVVPQVQVPAVGEHAFGDRTSLRVSGSSLWEPGGLPVFAGYAGPRFSVGEHYSVAPMVGPVINWTGRGDLAPLASVWQWLDFGAGDRFHLAAETDAFSFPRGSVCYGSYAASVDFADIVSVGGQAEHVNRDVLAGVHADLTFGPVTFGVAYYRGVGGDGDTSLDSGDGMATQALRFAVVLEAGD